MLKYVLVINSVVWLNISLVPYWCMCGGLFGMSLIPNQLDLISLADLRFRLNLRLRYFWLCIDLSHSVA